MAIQGSSATLQGGTGITIPNYNPQQTSKLQVQPAMGVPLYSSGQLAINSGNKASAGATTAINQANDQSSEINRLLAQLAAANKQVYAPALDYNSIYNKANAQAQEAVNPLYTKQLNDFLAQQAASKAQTEQQTQMNITNLQDTLKNTLEGNAITGARTTEDTAKNLADINTTADQYQTDTGQKFAADRITQAGDLAKSGLTGGIGAQQTEASTLARNTAEARQGVKFQQGRVDQELSKARTFEDLARAGELAKSSATKGEKQANFDLGNFITN